MQDTYVCLDVYVVLVSVIPIPDPLTPPNSVALRWPYRSFFLPAQRSPLCLKFKRTKCNPSAGIELPQLWSQTPQPPFRFNDLW